MDINNMNGSIPRENLTSNTSTTTNINKNAGVTMDINSLTDKRQHLVFVYGTLKCKFPNWKFMPKARTYAGIAKTTKPYPLVVGTEKNIPFMLNIAEPSEKHVYGELYLFDDEGLQFTDVFEEVLEGFYVRESIEVVVVEPTDGDCSEVPDLKLEKGTKLIAWAYFRAPAGLGPPYALAWTVDALKKLPHLERYSLEVSKTYDETDVGITQSLLDRARDICEG